MPSAARSWTSWTTLSRFELRRPGGAFSQADAREDGTVLMQVRFRDAIASGAVTQTFRRWKRPQVRAGRTYRTAAGRIVVDSIDVVNPARITAADAALDATAREAIRTRLARLDRASTHGPWTIDVLRAIAARPATRAADLAASFGRDTQPFKLDVRKLKNLGLTLSLEVGYRLSPRGEAYLAAFDA